MTLWEQPLLILFFGTLGVAMAAVVWVQTRRTEAFAALTVAITAVAGLLAVERLVVTPGEQVAATLRTLARRLEANDVEGVLEFISPQAERLRQEVRTALQGVRVKKLTIKRNLTVAFGSTRPRTSAEARFNAVGSIDASGAFGGPRTVARYVVVRLRYEGGAWRVRSYETFDPRGESAGGRIGPATKMSPPSKIRSAWVPDGDRGLISRGRHSLTETTIRGNQGDDVEQGDHYRLRT